MSKKIFENRARNFWELMAKNAEVETLTQEHGTKYAPTGKTRLY